MEQLVSFDVHEKNLRNDLETLQEDVTTSVPWSQLSADEAKFFEPFIIRVRVYHEQ